MVCLNVTVKLDHEEALVLRACRARVKMLSDLCKKRYRRYVFDAADHS